MKDRRLGRFVVSEKLLFDAIDTGHGANVFHGLIPLEIRHNFLGGKFEYLGWHAGFDHLPEGEVIPDYRAVFDDGETFPRWERMDALKGAAA